ncbi:MAG: hypothetical protein ACXVY9_10845 [Terriglobales bacterium]
MTIKPGQQSLSADVKETYVVCLDCGKEFAYDWQEMRFVSSRPKTEAIEEAAESYAKSA